VSAEAGPVFQKRFAARGLAIGDYDNDGAIDVLVAVNGGAPILLKNDAVKGRNWLGIKLEGINCNRDAVGARIYWAAGGKRRQRLKNNGGSYLSSHDPREVLGMGIAAKIDELEIHWPAPSKRIDRFKDVAANRYIRIVEGKPTAS
ncbi:MAG: ASPIC/UnbV domain-containing protein, partial [Bryobacteraceae bacterium]